MVQFCDSSITWEDPSVEGDVPTVRYGHASAMVNNRIFVWGGIGGHGDKPVYNNDLYMLDVKQMKEGWKRLYPKGIVPSAREGHTLTALGTMIYLFGGVQETEAYIGEDEEIWRYDTTKNIWEKLSVTGTRPHARLNHSAAVVGTDLYIYGGYFEGNTLDDLYVFHTSRLEWRKPPCKGDTPAPRRDHTCTSVGSKLYIFGGMGVELYNDITIFDSNTNTWSTPPQPKINRELKPSPREFHTAVAIGWGVEETCIVIFGGSDTEESTNDIWIYDLRRNCWQTPIENGFPLSPRWGHTAVARKEVIYIFGGSDQGLDFNDLRTMKLIKAESSEDKSPVVDDPVVIPRNYSTRTPIPANTFFSASNDTSIDGYIIGSKSKTNTEKAQDDIKRVQEMIQSNMNSMFKEISLQCKKLENEKITLEREKMEYQVMYRSQQQELTEIMQKHKAENEKWLEYHKTVIAKERSRIEEVKTALKGAYEQLKREQQSLEAKNANIEVIFSKLGSL
eukprot:Nk52_evm10s268 gene=Nk52_evmTU10s268